jgi:hypothetical protein
MKAEELKKILSENFGYVGFGSISYIEPHTQIDDIVTVINSALKIDTMYAFLYCCDTYKSSYATVSVHRTRKGAEMAMEFHRNEAKKKHYEIYNRLDDIYTHPFGESEDWQVSEIKIFE